MCEVPNAMNRIEDPGPPKSEVPLDGLLERLDGLIGTLRRHQYDADKDYSKTSNRYFDGKGDGFEISANLLTEIIKSC
ncbi:MAG: hypothetical protein ACYS1A_18810 [Planctomycetota bacterium]|jgi:hypothetical protein